MAARRKPKGLLPKEVKAVKASPAFYPRVHRRSVEERAGPSDEARAALSAALGAGEKHRKQVANALSRVEFALGAYLPAQAWFDYPPRPAEQAKALRSIRIRAYALWNQIVELDPRPKERLAIELLTPEERARFESEARRFQPGSLMPYEQSLVTLVDACSAAARKLEDTPSMGAPPKAALGAVVDQLRQVFAANAKGWSRKRPKRGAIEGLSEYETREVEFVSVALDDAKILKRGEAATAKVRRLCTKSLAKP